jgi:hypothetical protein
MKLWPMPRRCVLFHLRQCVDSEWKTTGVFCFCDRIRDCESKEVWHVSAPYFSETTDDALYNTLEF